jgi:ATPase subunit of ABC transporter with duplicated ATPase domains
MVPYGNVARSRGKSRSKNKAKQKKAAKKRRVRTSKVITKEQELRFVSDLEKRSGKPIGEWFDILKKLDPQKKLLQDELGLHLEKNFRVGKWDGKLIAFYYQHPERLESPSSE